MNRKSFLRLTCTVFPSICILTNCKGDKESIHKLELLDVHEKYMELYNNGRIEEILSNYYDINCTYMADSISGDFKILERSLNIINKYQKRKGILPIKAINKQIEVIDNIGWVICELTNNSAKTKHGLSTQIFSNQKSNWKIIHDHFSE